MKRLWWCVAVFVVAVALGNFVAPPLIGAMKPLDNGTYSLGWASENDTASLELEISGTKKDAIVNGPGFSEEISRYSGETDRGLVFFFPFEPDRRSYDFYDPFGDVTARIDYVGPSEVEGLKTLSFRGTFRNHGYTAERTFEVERRMGTLIDATWDLTESPSPSPAPGAYTFDEETRAAQLAVAEPKVRLLTGLQVLAWVSRFVAFLAAVAGVVILVRRR